MIRLVIQGKPRAWQRARLGRRGQHFTDRQTRGSKKSVGWTFKAEAPGHRRWPAGTPVRMWVIAYFPIPVRTSKARRELMATETVWYPHKSDWDNIGKLPSDALNGIAYVDDCQVADGRVRKFYSPRPRVEIELEELT